MEYQKTKEGYNLYPENESELRVIEDFLKSKGITPKES